MNTISSIIMGGLGNMMFQVANGYSVSIENGMNFVVDVSNYHGGKYGFDNPRGGQITVIRCKYGH